MTNQEQVQRNANDIQEYPAVRTTIVGGRPPGCGKPLGPIPRGIEVLVKKAAVDPEFKLLLMQKRAKAAREIGLVLEPAEETMLDLIPTPQLEAIIARTTVDPRVKPAFLGRAAAVMLVALGASAVHLTNAQEAVMRGIRVVETPPTPPTTTSTAPVAQGELTRPEDLQICDGIRPSLPRPPVEMAGVRPGLPVPAVQPASHQATTTQASQPTTFPAVTRDQIMPILKQMDSQVFKDREEAQKKIQDLGWGAFATLQQILKSEKLSLEVVSRIKAAMWTLKTTTRPALLNSPARPEQVVERIGMRADTPPPAGPTENPED